MPVTPAFNFEATIIPFIFDFKDAVITPLKSGAFGGVNKECGAENFGMEYFTCLLNFGNFFFGFGITNFFVSIVGNFGCGKFAIGVCFGMDACGIDAAEGIDGTDGADGTDGTDGVAGVCIDVGILFIILYYSIINRCIQNSG